MLMMEDEGRGGIGWRRRALCVTTGRVDDHVKSLRSGGGASGSVLSSRLQGGAVDCRAEMGRWRVSQFTTYTAFHLIKGRSKVQQSSNSVFLRYYRCIICIYPLRNSHIILKAPSFRAGMSISPKTAIPFRPSRTSASAASSHEASALKTKEAQNTHSLYIVEPVIVQSQSL